MVVVVFRLLLLGARSRMALIKIWTVSEGRIQKKGPKREKTGRSYSSKKYPDLQLALTGGLYTIQKEG